jgi:hypothetical protein
MSIKIKIHEPSSSYKSQHIMPAYKGGKEKHLLQQTQTKHTAQESSKPSPNSQHNSNNSNLEIARGLMLLIAS